MERFKLQSLNLKSLHESWKEPSDVGKIHESSKVLVDVGELKLKIKNMGHDSYVYDSKTEGKRSFCKKYTIFRLNVYDRFK